MKGWEGLDGILSQGLHGVRSACRRSGRRSAVAAAALETVVVGKVKIISENEASPGDFLLTLPLLNIESCIYVNIF